MEISNLLGHRLSINIFSMNQGTQKCHMPAGTMNVSPSSWRGSVIPRIGKIQQNRTLSQFSSKLVLGSWCSHFLRTWDWESGSLIGLSWRKVSSRHK